ncbi:MAG: DUF86 domain-containing protein [Burkholderiaceae bacterium]|nr:DUF86 domain-containing protein [Burkholderiaceae bacterium]
MKPAIDTAVVDARLRELSRRLDRLAFRRPASLAQLQADEDLQDIVTRNLELAVQSAIDIAMHLCAAHGEVPTSGADAFTRLANQKLISRAQAQRLRRSVGFRNVLAHEYVALDWTVVMHALDEGVADLSSFGRQTVKLLDRLDRD